MPRYNVEYNGKWACFSSISDGFITNFMDKSDYEKWRSKEYGKYAKKAEESNMITMKEVAYSIRLNRTREEALEKLLESGLSEPECTQILNDMESDHYVPIPKQNEKYECPNCYRDVDREQRSCEGDDCCLDFVWRT